MDVRLISEDAELYKLCREILVNLRGQPWDLSVVSTQSAGTDADLYIWDFHPSISLRDQIHGSSAKHLFLVSRKDLADFRLGVESFEPVILLKPVTRAALTTFLDLAVSSQAATSLLEDRDRILQCLIQTNLKLQEYDQDRTNFLARAIHDFRAPLTALSGYCGLLLSGPMGPLSEKQEKVLGRMQRSLERLSRLTNAMYQMSVGRQVKSRPSLHKAEIRDCVEQAVHEIAPFTSEKRITVTVNLQPSEQLLFDTGQLEQVLVNLLDNACKFTPRFGEIEIRGYSYFWERRVSCTAISLAKDRRRGPCDDQNSYRIDVRDSGAAIPAERLDQIFEEYTSYAGSVDRSGSGLGLAICRMIMALHDGCIWAENTEAGPIFSLILPVHSPELCSGVLIEHESTKGVRL
jgi:signal transduction histidine kinase